MLNKGSTRSLVFSLFLLGLLPQASQANDPCSPDGMLQTMQACGMDIGCINQVNADFIANCMGNLQPDPPQPQPATPTPQPGPMGDQQMQQRIEACGMDFGCLNNLMQQMQGNLPQTPMPFPMPAPTAPEGDFELPDPSDPNRRLQEQTVLPASWLQTYQNTLVNCADDSACWEREITIGVHYPQRFCGTNMLEERTIVCLAAASAEVHIETAIAQQVLARKGIRIREPGQPAPANGNSDPQLQPWEPGEAARRAAEFTPEVKRGRVLAILDRWRTQLQSQIPAAARESVAAAADVFPLNAAPGQPALSYELVGESFELKPSRRDWAYAMIGNLLTQAGFMESGANGKTLLDLGMWCFVKAAQLKLEAEHLSNVGFHLNLRARLEAARDLLIYANQLAPRHADTHNNLAFSYSALGETEQAETAQEMAYRADPHNPHIRSRYQSMIGQPLPEQPNNAGIPPGWDFGEAYFRLTKRHALREYWGAKHWSEAQKQAEVATHGGDMSGRKYLGWYKNVTEDGPAEWYSKRTKDIGESYDRCTDGAPEIPHGCPFGAGIYHPSCEKAASPEEIAVAEHNRKAHYCRCNANRIQAEADALNAYIDNAQAVWAAYEKKWRPILLGQEHRWSADIRATNLRYPEGSFQYPVETAYAQWMDDFTDESQHFWGDYLPGKLASWHELKSQAQGLKACAAPRLPPPPKVEKPKPEKKTTKAYGINLGVVKWEVRLDGSFSFEFDVAIIKGGYSYNADTATHEGMIGTGPLEGKVAVGNPPPGSNAPSFRSEVTCSLNFLDNLPGPARIPGQIANQGIAFDGKFSFSWNDRTGHAGQFKVEAKPKFGVTNGKDVTVTGYSRLQN